MDDPREVAPDVAPVVVARLTALWERHLDRTIVCGTRVPPTNVYLINALAHHTMRLGRAVLRARDVGLDVELVPWVRLSMECAMTAAWLSVRPEAGDVLLRHEAGARRTTLNAIRDLTEGETSVPDEQTMTALAQVNAVLEESTAAHSWKSLEQRMDDLYGGRQVYVLYRALSAQSHAGLGIVEHYSFEVDADVSAFGLAFRHSPPLPEMPSLLGIQACMVLVAHQAMDSVRAKPWHTQQIQREQNRLGFTPTIRLRNEA